ncbi:hypothetical protein Tco_0255260 [Tanacetum coccineum]
MVGNNAVHNQNQIVRNQQGNVAALVIGNNGNGQNANQIRCYNYRGACIPLTSEQHNFLSYASDEEREEGELTNNYLFMTKLLPTSPNTDTALMHDTDGIPDVPNFNYYYDNETYNLFAYEEQHPKLPEYSQGTFLEQQNNSNIHSETLDMDFGGEDGEQHAVNDEETKAYFESLLHKFKVELDKFVLVNRNDKIKIERLTTELAQYKGQQKDYKSLEKEVDESLEKVKLWKKKMIFSSTMKKDIDEIEMINIELENTQKRVLTDSLIAQLNCKTVKNVDLIAQLHEKTFVNDKLRKIIKGKNVNTNFAKPSILGKPPSPKPMVYSSLPKSRLGVRIKSLLDAVRITTAHVFVNTAQLNSMAGSEDDIPPPPPPPS